MQDQPKVVRSYGSGSCLVAEVSQVKPTGTHGGDGTEYKGTAGVILTGLVAAVQSEAKWVLSSNAESAVAKAIRSSNARRWREPPIPLQLAPRGCGVAFEGPVSLQVFIVMKIEMPVDRDTFRND